MASIQDTITVGTRVVFSRTFLGSIGQYTGEVPFLQGTVTDVQPVSGAVTLCTVCWDSRLRNGGYRSSDEVGKALNRNLWPLDRLHLEPR